MYEIYSTITRQMILNIIKEMTNRVNLASAKPVDHLVSITVQFPSLFPSVSFFAFILSLSLFFFFYTYSFFKCIPLLFIVNLTCIIKSTMIYVAGKGKHNKL